MSSARLKARLRLHEGCPVGPNRKPKLYQCPAGKWTIGFGWNIEDRGIPWDIAEQLLDIAMADAEADARSCVSPRAWERMNPTRREVLQEMAFWMGRRGLLGFRKTLAAIEAGDWDTAAGEMFDSKAAREYPSRMVSLCNLMRDSRHEL